MKFIHLGDLHLGKSLFDFDLIDDQKYILDEILTLAAEEKVDAVLMAGDIYDKPIPSEAATNLLDYFLCHLAQLGIKTCMISGNHDSDDRLNFGSQLFASNHIFIAAKYNGVLYKQTLEDEYGPLNVYLLPFVKASQVRHYFPQAKIENYSDAVRAVLENAAIDTTHRNVLVAHQFVTGGDAAPTFGGSESLGVQNVGLVEQVSASLFDAFDYVALGHIHSGQRVSRETVRYAGSPLKYSLSEVKNDKTVPLVTLGEKGDVAIELRPLKPKRDLRHVKGTLKSLLDVKQVTSPEDYIYATLTDDDIITDVMAVFRQTYPNVVSIDYDNARTRYVEKVDISNIAENKSFEDLIGDFYRLMYNMEISDEEMAVMKAVAVEAGIKNEAD